MPALGKKSLSLFLRIGCERQFVLSLYTNKELTQNGMPPKQTGRAGLGLTGQAGYDYQAEKVSELKAVFGDANVEINPNVKKSNQPEPLELGDYLSRLKPYQFIVEARYEVETRAFQESRRVFFLLQYQRGDSEIKKTQHT